MNDPNLTDWITAGAAVIAVIGAAVTILDSRRTARRTLTYEYVSRMNDPDMIEVTAKWSSFMRCGMVPPGISDGEWRAMSDEAREEHEWEHFAKMARSRALGDRRTLLELTLYGNFLEELAGMYNHRLLDKRIVKTYVSGEAENFWTVSDWWLSRLRADPESNTYQELCVMLNDLRSAKRPSWHRPGGPDACAPAVD
jgi:hypothetical protein